ncbi:hypothetical protein SAMN05216302_1001266 [Nitrosomonas aestuarii]|uniref:Uncharacterized protein n=1 Tax=Nitrosomonas aestuarii TaxID=52441 RepID=A0A1I3XFJ4_9PROT|nr:hypothetical protein SAMN05216302_1001266 [Nitrosomonas aestuarii]
MISLLTAASEYNTVDESNISCKLQVFFEIESQTSSGHDPATRTVGYTALSSIMDAM